MRSKARTIFQSRAGVKSRKKLRLLCSRSIAKRGVSRPDKHRIIVDRALAPRNGNRVNRKCPAFRGREVVKILRTINQEACDNGSYC